MIAVKTADVRNDFKSISDLATSGEAILIVRPHNHNVVLISEKEYRELINDKEAVDDKV